MIRRTQDPSVQTNHKQPQLPLPHNSKQMQRPRLKRLPLQPPPSVAAKEVSLPEPQAEVDFVNQENLALTSWISFNITM